MGVLILNVVGVNAYVPHTDENSLLVVMPNASRLGTSPAGALDGTPLARHLPFLYEETADADGNFSVTVPKPFPGARLSFLLDGTPSPPDLNLSAITPIAQKGFLDLHANVLTATPDSRVSGQVLVTAGVVGIFNPPPPPATCDPAWSRVGFPASLDTVVPGLTIRIEGVTLVQATAVTWVGAGSFEIYNRLLDDDEEVQLYVGNLCAEDALDWPRNSVAGRIHDNDFKWIYGLSNSADLPDWINDGLPVPVVNGSPIQDHFSSSQAFNSFWGGGGGAGCECNGCVDRPRTF
jgi:hypothetical protein